MEKDELSKTLKLGGAKCVFLDLFSIYVFTITFLTGYTISPAMLNSIFIRFAKKLKFLIFDDCVLHDQCESCCQHVRSHDIMMSLLFKSRFSKLSRYEESQ